MPHSPPPQLFLAGGELRELGLNEEELRKIQSEVASQERLLAGYQTENERLTTAKERKLLAQEKVALSRTTEATCLHRDANPGLATQLRRPVDFLLLL